VSSDPKDWKVNSRCINCMASRTMAPDFIKEVDSRSVFVRQPETLEEIEAAWRALLVCPTVAVEAPEGAKMSQDLFPQDLGQGVFRLGFNAKSSFGAHSYYGIAEDTRFMVDAPRWSSRLVAWIEAQGGLQHVLLTHRDDVADASNYAKHFGARVWIHEGDAASAPFATDIMRGADPVGPFERLSVIYVPGHTRGSVMYLLDDHSLFTGDSLAWNFERQSFDGHPEYNWFDWEKQLESIGRLRERTFSRVLAGHGGSVSLPSDRMHAELNAMLAAS
jgi:glyoxylase-like metal-dependent hydrolase (beta-lactamase superfamily II)